MADEKEEKKAKPKTEGDAKPKGEGKPKQDAKGKGSSRFSSAFRAGTKTGNYSSISPYAIRAKKV